MDFFLFQVFPYIAMMSFIIGSILRFDRDPYSWRSKSSQLLCKKQLIIGSVLFHAGIIVILVGHIFGLLTPIFIIDAIGISHSIKQVLAMSVGGVAGMLSLVGLVILLHRRLFNPRIRETSSFSDIAVLFLLLAQLILGLFTIVLSMEHLDGHEMVKFMNWAQHIVTFRSGAHEFVSDVALLFKAHLTLGMLILLVWPFTRLVHVFSVPLGFVFRPYQVVRKRAK